jgi:16S rRNA (adenine1518-N6/adenine1519-N6)-dimethyltransferase
MTSPGRLLKAWNLTARKELGQNFLTEPSLAAHIVSLAELQPDESVVDIGAGLGAMTLAAARIAPRVVAVEKDSHLIPLLRAELLAQGLDRVDVREHDILKFDLPLLSQTLGRSLTVIGNLPYNISSPVLIKLIKERRVIRRAVLMFQKELADRLLAGPGSRTYGRLSVMLGYCATVRLLREVRADLFFPKPKVGSTVLAIDFKTEIVPRVNNESFLEKVVQAAFGQRRKTLRNALSGSLLGLSPAAAAEVLTASGIDPLRRAETVSVAEFVTLTDRVELYLAAP